MICSGRRNLACREENVLINRFALLSGQRIISYLVWEVDDKEVGECPYNDSDDTFDDKNLESKKEGRCDTT